MAVEKRRYMNMMLGLFVVVGIVLLVTLIFLIGKERRVFDTSSHVQAYFANVAGLAVGAEVMLAGVTVGHVSDVLIPTLKMGKPNFDRRIRVVMRVSKDVMPWLRKDSIARVDSKGLLGDKTINISLGSPQVAGLKEGGTLQSIAPLDINDALAKAQTVLENVTRTVEDVSKAFAGFQERGGDKAISDTLHSIRNITTEIESGNGIVHNLIYDHKAGNDFKGTIHSLHGAASNMDSVLSKVKEGDGLLHGLVYDPARGNLMANLNAASANLKAITSSVKDGQGTIGRLLNDTSVYDDLKQILGRVKRNEVLKALVRYSISR